MVVIVVVVVVIVVFVVVVVNQLFLHSGLKDTIEAIKETTRTVTDILRPIQDAAGVVKDAVRDLNAGLTRAKQVSATPLIKTPVLGFK